MSKVIYVKSLYRNQEEYLSKEIEISGWVRTLRDQKILDLLK